MRFDGGCLGGFGRLEDMVFEASVGWGRGGRGVWFAFSSMGMDWEDGCEGFGCTFFAKARLSRHVERRRCVLSERLVGG